MWQETAEKAVPKSKSTASEFSCLSITDITLFFAILAVNANIGVDQLPSSGKKCLYIAGEP